MRIHFSYIISAVAAICFASAFTAKAQPYDFRHDESFYSHEAYQSGSGVGYNKYLVSNVPNSAGEYTVRLETFVTGDVKEVSVPTDFVLVLDVSGSMLFDYNLDNTPYPDYYATTAAGSLYLEDNGEGDDCNNRVKISQYGYTMFGYTESGGTIHWFTTLGHWNSFISENGVIQQDATQYETRYVYYSGDSEFPAGYYKVYRTRRRQNDSSKWHRNLCIIRNTSSGLKYRYLWGTGIQTTPNYDANTEYTTETEGLYTTIYSGPIYRVQQRRDALLDAVQAFANLIAVENGKDQWTDGVTRHQVAMVQFGAGYSYGSTDADNITERYGKDSFTKVIKSFTQVTNSNKGDFRTALNRSTFIGSTYLEMGVHKAKALLENLALDPTMVPLNAYGGVNRNKVVIVFTDGGISPKDGTSGADSDYFYRISQAIADANTLKQTEDGKLNAKIYSIDLANADYAQAMLERISSDYKGVTCKSSGGYSRIDVGGGVTVYDAATDYPTGNRVDTQYYQDASHTDLTTIFSNIAGENTGENTGSTMVAVDKMSNSFVLPASLKTNPSKVKFYTMQCWGKKTINGTEYLAFGSPILVPTRSALQHLWCQRVDETSGSVDWYDAGPIDIDGTPEDPLISYEVSDDLKTITIKGFDYAKLWCGHDNIASHNNTVHGSSPDNKDINYDYIMSGYRGFKLIVEFPVILEDDAVGGPNVQTNDSLSGLYAADSNGNPTGTPIINYPIPDVAVPVTLRIKKTGLKPGESASFTVQRKDTRVTGATYVDFTTFILTGDDTNTPEVRLVNLDPNYHYKVKETGWSWSYTRDTREPSTEDTDLSINPIVFENTSTTTTIKHAEAKATNVLKNN